MDRRRSQLDALAVHARGKFFPHPGRTIENRGTTALSHCTVSGNSSPVGGGINNADGATLALTNSIIAGNSFNDINNAGTITGGGANIVAVIEGAGENLADGTIISAAPLLSALGNYGGTAWTMVPISGSPAIDAAVGSAETMDQRGFLRPADGDGNGIAVNDIGAVELTAADGAYLANLSLSSGSLSPAFNNSNRYQANVVNESTDIIVTPTAMGTNATITVNGAVVASGTPSGNIPLTVGTNMVVIAVAAASVTNTYFLFVYRPDNPRISAA